jgi:hypothetical protein
MNNATQKPSIFTANVGELLMEWDQALNRRGPIEGLKFK